MDASALMPRAAERALRIRARTHATEGEWKAGAFSGGALMRMLLIIQFVNSRYILIVPSRTASNKNYCLRSPCQPIVPSFVLRFLRASRWFSIDPSAATSRTRVPRISRCPACGRVHGTNVSPLLRTAMVRITEESQL